MTLKKFYVDGFRNLYNTTLDFDNNNGLVGLNNYGKSNLLKALLFFHDSETNNLEFKYFTKNKLINEFSVNKYNGSKATMKMEAEYELEIKHLYLKKENHLKKYFQDNKISKLYISLKREFKKNGEFQEILSIRQDTKNSKYRMFLKKHFNSDLEMKAKYSDDRMSKRFTDQYENSFYDVKEFLALIGTDYFEIVNKVLSYKIHRPFVESTYNFEGVDNEQYRSMAKDLSDSKKKDKNFKLLCNLFKKLIPSIEEVVINDFIALHEGVDTPVEYFYITVLEKNHMEAKAITELSTGSQKVFYLLYLMIFKYSKYSSSMILLEELENTIHPRLFKELILILEELIGTNQLLLTSHSPYLINYFGTENTYIGIPNSENLAIFKSLRGFSNKIKKYAEEEKISQGEFVFNLMLDNFEDNYDLQEFFKEEDIWGK